MELSLNKLVKKERQRRRQNKENKGKKQAVGSWKNQQRI